MSEIEPNRRKEIFEAALRVFSREGFHKATIKQIAREANLKSPSLIYWYFKDKFELLQAILTEVSPLIRQASDPAPLMDLPARQVFTLIMKAYYSTLDQPGGVELVRLVFTQSVSMPEVARQFSGGQIQVVHFLTGYLEHQVRLGRLRPHNCRAVAQAFLGAMFTYLLSTEIMPYLGEGLPAREEYLQAVVTTFLKGLEPD